MKAIIFFTVFISIYMNRPIGAHYNPTNRTCRFSVWAPEAREVKIVLQQTEGKSISMQPADWGYWQAEVNDLDEGTLYKFQLDDTPPLPDPASRLQPEGPHGPSAVVNLNFPWKEGSWKGLDTSDLIIYEAHIGTFSDKGTFAGAAEKLDYLLELGINAIEIMPVAQFPGNRNWGYDGVSLFATQNSYGGPDAFRDFINSCHQKGIAVILDVVYNHLGPEGNYLSQFGPYFTDKYNTPWGQALNFDDAWCDGVRNFFLQNALMWLRDFHVDGLRLDAVHAIKDLSAHHFLELLSEETDRLSAETGRKHFLIAEVDLNDNRFITDREKGGYGLHAQWVDEFHHALHSWLTGETNGYYSDFGDFDHIIRAYKDTYVYNGVYSPHRKKVFGSSAADHPNNQFVVFAQNHDQVGNRMLGERLTELISFEGLKVAAAAYILSPYIPMLFMGEEWGEKAPFYYFVSHTDPQLVEAVRNGRKKEFADFHAHGEPPDPQSEETFNASKLNWDLKEKEEHNALWKFYQRLIRIRKSSEAYSVPQRDSFRLLTFREQPCLGLLKEGSKESILTLLNLGNKEATLSLNDLKGSYRLMLNSEDAEWLGNKRQLPEKVEEGQQITLAPLCAVIYEKLL